MIRLPAEVRTEFVYPTVPPDALTCLPEVVVPEALTMEGASDNQATAYGEEQRMAGADCRAKLDWVRALVATWPKPEE